MVDRDQSAAPSDGQYVGGLLRSAREQARVSVEEAAAGAQLSERHVRALEAGDFSGFSAEVYARGACERYARFLGVDDQALRRAWQRALREERVVRPLRVYTPASLLERLLTPRLVVGGGGVLLALLIGGYVIWQVQSFWQLPGLRLETPKEGLVTEESIRLRGSAGEEARVRVNGEPVLLSADYSFDLEIWLHPGVNVVRVEAENAAGRVARVERHVVRE